VTGSNVAVENWKFLDKLGIASARWFEGFGWWTSLRRTLEIAGQLTQPLDPSKPTVLTCTPIPLPGRTSAAVHRRAHDDVRYELRGNRDGRAEQFTRMFGDGRL